MIDSFSPNSKNVFEEEGIKVRGSQLEEKVAMVALDSTKVIIKALKPGTTQTVTDFGRSVYNNIRDRLEQNAKKKRKVKRKAVNSQLGFTSNR